MAKKKTFIYLARRDKKGAQVMLVLSQGTSDFPPTRIVDVKQIGLSEKITNAIQTVVYKHRMKWEPFIACAENYSELKSILTKNGYNNLPLYMDMAFPQLEELIDQTTTKESPKIAQKKEPIKTMIRKKD